MPMYCGYSRQQKHSDTVTASPLDLLVENEIYADLDDDWSFAKGAPTGNICSGDAVAPSPSELLIEAEAVLDQQPSWIDDDRLSVRGTSTGNGYSGDAVAASPLGMLLDAEAARDFQLHDSELSARGTQSGNTYSGLTLGGETRAILGNVSYVTYNNVTNPSEQPAEEKRRGKLLRTLEFDRMNHRQLTVGPAHTLTCKPGSGKSTLMKFILNNMTHRRRARECKTMSFFFNARGEYLERSTEGCYRSLLHQMLQQFPRLHDSIRIPQPLSKGQASPIAMLQNVFHEAVLSLQHEKMVVMIDALDECDQKEIRSMVQFFGSLADAAELDGVTLNTCFASRHYPSITVRFCETLLMENSKGHTQDIFFYARDSLIITPDVQREEILDQVMQKAEGVFLWVVLVVRTLNEQFDEGRSHAQLLDAISKLPDDLDALIGSILSNGASDQHLLPTLMWVLSVRATTSDMTYAAIKLGAGDTSHLQETRSHSPSFQWQHDYLVNGDIDDQTHSNGYGLPRAARARFWFSLEMAYAYKAYTLDRLHNFPKSQYIRMTNYFRSSGPSTRPLASSASFLHLILSFKCLRPSSEVLDPSHNVLVDMVEGLLEHCATCTSTISDGQDLDGCPTMSCSEFLIGRDLNDYCGGRFGTPLIAALSLSTEDPTRLRLVTLLLNAGADVNICSGGKGPDSCEGIDECSPLSAAAISRDNNAEHSLIELILDRSSIDYGSPLGAAAYWQAQAIVKLLLDRGADVNLEDSEDCNIALKEAVSVEDNTEIVEMLVRAGAYAKYLMSRPRSVSLLLTRLHRSCLNNGCQASPPGHMSFSLLILLSSLSLLVDFVAATASSAPASVPAPPTAPAESFLGTAAATTSLFEDRVEHAATCLHRHRHRNDFTKDFTAFYNNHKCDILVERSQDAFTRAGEKIFDRHPGD
ncbi:hypothetical protein Q7P36_000724 [Cladosporium allicinum]